MFGIGHHWSSLNSGQEIVSYRALNIHSAMDEIKYAAPADPPLSEDVKLSLLGLEQLASTNAMPLQRTCSTMAEAAKLFCKNYVYKTTP